MSLNLSQQGPYTMIFLYFYGWIPLTDDFICLTGYKDLFKEHLISNMSTSNSRIDNSRESEN